MKAFLAAASIAVALGGAATARATTTLYYTGKPFTRIDSPSLGTSLDATVTLDEDLPADFTGGLRPSPLGHITSFTLTAVGSSGVSVSSNSNYGYVFSEFIYLTAGQVTYWELAIESLSFGGIFADTHFGGDSIQGLNDGPVNDTSVRTGPGPCRNPPPGS